MVVAEKAGSTDFDEKIVIDWDAAVEQVSSGLVRSHFNQC